MVSDKVEIETKSYLENESAVRWVSEDGMDYELTACDRAERGTCITLHVSEEDADFLNFWTLRSTLEKHCAFMPVPVYVSEVKELKEGENPAEPQQVNDTSPLWMKRPNECTDEEYLEFYHKVFHDMDDPLFWIHLNAEFPFNLKGILYFPKLKNEFTANEGVIKLYNNQVFVADNIKEVIPEFLMLLKGAIDCPDLPLNVSRSFLQNDCYEKTMSAYITRKVADKLTGLFNTERENYQTYWDDIHPFVKYGCIKDNKFYERVKNAIIYKTTDGSYMTLGEYTDQNCDGEERVVYYASDAKRQAQMIAMFREQEMDVVVLDTLIDTNFISFLEYDAGEQKLSFKRVDSAADGLTEDGEVNEEIRKALEERFRAATDDKELALEMKAFKSEDAISMITVDEQNRRFTEMSKRWGGMQMALPEKRTLVLNSRHPLVKWLEESEDGELSRDICAQVADLAEMARQPLVAERMVDFLRRSNQLLTKVIGK